MNSSSDPVTNLPTAMEAPLYPAHQQLFSSLAFSAFTYSPAPQLVPSFEWLHLQQAPEKEKTNMMQCITISKARISETAAAMLVLLWVYAALSKWLDHSTFLFQLERSPLVGWAALPLSIGIPLAELLLAVLLVFPPWRRTGLLLSAEALSFFSIYISWGLLFSERVPCSCGGVIGALRWGAHLALNIGLMLVGLWGWRAGER